MLNIHFRYVISLSYHFLLLFITYFPGDLNYRKLVGDREWPPETTSFDEALLQFNPAPLLSLRTLKSEVCVGLEEGAVRRLDKASCDWMVEGEYAVVQFTQTVLPVQLPCTEARGASNKHRVAFNQQ